MMKTGIVGRHRRGIGAVGLALLAAGLILAVSIISTGGRGLWFTDDGFLGRPRSPDSASAQGTEQEVQTAQPAAPLGADVASLKLEVDAAQRDVQAALVSGDQAKAQAAREILAKKQALLNAALSR